MSLGSTAQVALERKSVLTPTALAHAAFVPTGIVTVLLGPLLPLLSARWSMNDAQAGEFFTVQFLASLAGNALLGVLAQRFGYRRVLVLGLLCMAAGVAGLPVSSRHWMGVAAVGGYGIGLGLVIPACNLLVAELNSAKRASAGSLLNFSWSVGAVACPFLLVPFQRAGHLNRFSYGLAGVLGLVMVLMAGLPVPGAATNNRSGVQWQALTALLLNPATIMLAILFFVYVGVENSVGGWLASYAKRVAGNAGAMWEVAPSFFYVGLLAGRGLAPLVLRRASEMTTVRVCLAMALLGVAALLGSGSLAAIFVSAGAIGLGLAAVYPITISLLPMALGESATRLGSLMFMLGSLGAAVMPKLVGVASTATSSLRIGLSLPLAGCAVLLGLYLRDWTRPGAASE